MTKQSQMSHHGGPTLPLTTTTTTNGTLRTPPKKRKIITCFNIILALVFLEAAALLILGFFSDNLALEELDLQAPLMYLQYYGADARAQDDDVGKMEDLLADKAEYALEAEIKGEASETELTTDNVKEAGGQERNAGEGAGKAEEGQLEQDDDEDPNPIDNYYSRKHITKERFGMKVPLVVGGSDGSGTRAFVEILGRLGVPMLVDDAGTMDVHGKKILKGKGWPPLASAVLQAVRSSNYNFEELPKTLQEMTVKELTHLRDDLIPRGASLIQKAASKNVTNISKDIAFGFKAPVSMLLVPILQQVLGPMKFLHVVRDGRDVAMSTNQSPVKKFYNDSYADAPERLKKYTGDLEHVMGMQLWNDWNTGLLEYERTHADGETLDFLVMRTEDLLNPEKKFKSLIQLANFVGSPKTVEELCCLSRQAIVDMGQSSSSRGGFGGRFQAYLESKNDFKGVLQRRYNGIPSQDQFQALLQRKRDSSRAGDSPMPEQNRGLPGRYLARPGNSENAAQQQDRKTKYKNLGALLAQRLSERQRQKEGGPSNGKNGSFGKSIVDRFNAMGGGEAESDSLGRRRLTEDMLLEKKPGEKDPRHRTMGFPMMGMHGLKDLSFQERRAEYDRLQAWRTRAQQRGDEKQSERLLDKLKHLEESGLLREEELDGLRAKLDSEHAADSGELAAKAQAAFARNMNGGVEASAGSGWKDRINSFRKKGEKPKDVVKRYGKWVELLKDKPEVSQKLHEEGAQGLSDFGYEPARRFQDPADDLDFLCDASVQCDDVVVEAEEAK